MSVLTRLMWTDRVVPETSVIVEVLLKVGLPILLPIMGGIIWIVREFGKVNTRLSLLEQSVKRLEDSPVYKAPFQPRQVEDIEGFEIIIRPKESEK